MSIFVPALCRAQNTDQLVLSAARQWSSVIVICNRGAKTRWLSRLAGETRYHAILIMNGLAQRAKKKNTKKIKEKKRKNRLINVAPVSLRITGRVEISYGRAVSFKGCEEILASRRGYFIHRSYMMKKRTARCHPLRVQFWPWFRRMYKQCVHREPVHMDTSRLSASQCLYMR